MLWSLLCTDRKGVARAVRDEDAPHIIGDLDLSWGTNKNFTVLGITLSSVTSVTSVAFKDNRAIIGTRNQDCG